MKCTVSIVIDEAKSIETLTEQINAKVDIPWVNESTEAYVIQQLMENQLGNLKKSMQLYTTSINALAKEFFGDAASASIQFED